MAGKTAVLIQDVTSYTVIRNKINRKIKFGKRIIYNHN